MSKTKSQSGNEVKECIVLLCRMCKYSGIFDKITPEHIRQAKFDKPEVIDILLELLCAFMSVKKSAKKGECTDIRNIISKLRICKYPRTNHMVDAHGSVKSSREVLLAVTWYMHCANLIDLFRIAALRPVDIIQLVASCENSHSKQDFSSHKRDLSLAEKATYITWLLSQIKLLSHQIIKLEAGNMKQKHKLAEHAKNEMQENPLLVVILRHPSLLREYEKLLERKCLLMQTYIKWKSMESVFWLWMDSVLTSARKEETKFIPSVLDEYGQSAPPKSDACTFNELKRVLRRKLNELQEELSIQEKEFWKKSTSNSDVVACLQPEQKAEIDKEMVKLKLNLEDAYHNPTLKCDKGSDASKLERHGHAVEVVIPVRWECERLKSLNKSLENDLKQKRLEANEQLTALSQRLSNVVLIPPVIPSH